MVVLTYSNSLILHASPINTLKVFIQKHFQCTLFWLLILRKCIVCVLKQMISQLGHVYSM